MLLAFSVPAQSVGLFELKEVIRTVIIKDILSALYDFLAVPVKLRLYKIVLFRKDGQGPVDVMKFKSRLLDEFGSLSVGRKL